MGSHTKVDAHCSFFVLDCPPVEPQQSMASGSFTASLACWLTASLSLHRRLAVTASKSTAARRGDSGTINFRPSCSFFLLSLITTTNAEHFQIRHHVFEQSICCELDPCRDDDSEKVRADQQQRRRRASTGTTCVPSHWQCRSRIFGQQWSSWRRVRSSNHGQALTSRQPRHCCCCAWDDE